MPLFSYVIRDKFKKVLKGTTKAKSEEDLKERFRGQGYLIFSITKINRANAPKGNENFLGSFNLSKLLFILILIGGSYLLVKLINQSSYKYREKENPVKVTTTPEGEPVIEVPKIITEKIIHKPEQDIINKVVPKPELEQKVTSQPHFDAIQSPR